MKFDIKESNGKFFVNFGGKADFGPVSSHKEAWALAQLYIGLEEATQGVEYDMYPTPESTLALLNKVLEALSN